MLEIESLNVMTVWFHFMSNRRQIADIENLFFSPLIVFIINISSKDKKISLKSQSKATMSATIYQFSLHKSHICLVVISGLLIMTQLVHLLCNLVILCLMIRHKAAWKVWRLELAFDMNQSWKLFDFFKFGN